VDDVTFDQLTRSLTQPRRVVVNALAAAGLAIFSRLGSDDDAQAKKKHKKRKKCKGGTTRCGKKACCRADQNCVNGKCQDKKDEAGNCLSDDDCAPGQTCKGGLCVEVVPGCGDVGDCDAGEVCINGSCVVIAGTCDAAADHCAVNESLCNEGGTGDCFCLQRFGGGAACTQIFVLGSVCGDCTSDAECEAVEAGSVCVSAVDNGCPCDPGQGICARLCLNQ
jgi:hypothetical protein